MGMVRQSPRLSPFNARFRLSTISRRPACFASSSRVSSLASSDASSTTGCSTCSMSCLISSALVPAGSWNGLRVFDCDNACSGQAYQLVVQGLDGVGFGVYLDTSRLEQAKRDGQAVVCLSAATSKPSLEGWPCRSSATGLNAVVAGYVLGPDLNVLKQRRIGADKVELGPPAVALDLRIEHGAVHADADVGAMRPAKRADQPAKQQVVLQHKPLFAEQFSRRQHHSFVAR